MIDFNGPSFGAYVKNCGWKVEGLFRRHVYRKGAYHDVYWRWVLKEEFDALPDSAEYIALIMPVDVHNKVNVPSEWWARFCGGRTIIGHWGEAGGGDGRSRCRRPTSMTRTKGGVEAFRSGVLGLGPQPRVRAAAPRSRARVTGSPSAPAPPACI